MFKQPSNKQVDAAIKALDKLRRDWLRRPGVTACDVGFKRKAGRLTDEVALRLHVERKLPSDALAKQDLVGGEQASTIDGFPTDVVVASYAPAKLAPLGEGLLEAEAVDRRGRVDPIVGGVSCGNPRVTAGTVGAIVFDRATGDPCILSNWHVLCGSPACAAGEAIFQPGAADGGTPADAVATLLRFRLAADADAALARLTGVRASDRDILGLAPIGGIDTPSLGMLVRKSGRTTAITSAIIDGVSLTTTLNYGNGVTQTFANQLHLVPRPPWPAVDTEISQGGDSGSVWINDATGNAVGLHFAGETTPAPAAEEAIANRMMDVATALNFQFGPVFVTPLLDLCRRFPQLCPRPVPPLLDLCRRFPQLCQDFEFPPFEIPGPNPRTGARLALTPQSASAEGGCNCGGRHNG